MFCPKCGNNVENNVNFCPACGENMGTPNPPAQPSTGYTQNTYTQAPPQAPPMPNQTYAPAYQAPVYQTPYSPVVNNSPMSVGDYIITYIVAAIPFVGIIMMFVWAFSSDVNVNKKNFCRAFLILAAIGIVIGIIFAIITAIIAAAAASSYSSYY